MCCVNQFSCFRWASIKPRASGGIRLVVKQSKFYSNGVLDANIHGGSNAYALLKLGFKTDQLLGELIKAAHSEELKNTVTMIKATYKFPVLLHYVFSDRNPMLALKMQDMASVLNFLQRMYRQLRIAAMALYHEKLNQVPSWIMLTVTLLAQMEDSDWQQVCKGHESIIEVAVKNAKRATTMTSHQSRSVLEQTIQTSHS